MKTVQLRVQDEFVEELLEMLPKDKVKVVDQKFLTDQNRLHEELNTFLTTDTEFFPYYEEMKTINNWIEEGGK